MTPYRSLARAYLFALLCLVVAVSTVLAAPSAPTEPADVAAARELFQKNLDAIRNRDLAAYLACYLDSRTMLRLSAEGVHEGFMEFARLAEGAPWPDVFEALDMRLVPLAPGVVFGTYHFRARYGDVEQSGFSERVFVNTPAGWRIATTGVYTTPAGTPPPVRALLGGTLIDGWGGAPVPNAVVVIKGDRIECAGIPTQCRVPAGADKIDVSGMFITPGIVDAHVHFSQTGWADGRPDALDVRAEYPYEEVQKRLRKDPGPLLRADLCSGVLGAFDVGGYPWTADLARRADADTSGPRVAATGPLLSTIDFPVNLPGEKQFVHLTDEDAAREAVHYVVKTLDVEAIKLWFIPDKSRDFAEVNKIVGAVGEEVQKQDRRLIAHATDLREAKAALAAGARVLVHGVDDQEIDEEFIELAKANRTFYIPTLTVRDGYRRMYQSIIDKTPPAVDDPNGCVDADTLARIARTPELGAGRIDVAKVKERLAKFEERSKIARANLMKAKQAKVLIAMGTDAGNPLTVHGPSVYAEMEAMQATGLKPMEVLVAATRSAAAAMGRFGDLGTIEPAKDAELLVVAADPTADIANMRKLRYVVRGGVVRSIDELRATKPKP